MPKFSVDRSININKSVEEVYKVISDFHTWQPWSPWLIMEPEVKVTVRDDGKYYEWAGDLVGSGNMTVLKEDENKSIDYDLTFLTPWKTQSKVGFILKPDGEGTKVNWTMEGSLPWFMFWMKKMMGNFIGMDYERGLKLLKDFSEDGKVYSKLEFVGETTVEGCKYIGIKRVSSFDDMANNHKADFTQLMEYARQNNLIAGDGFTIYHKWQIGKGTCEYTACVPVSEIPANLPNGFVSGERQKTKAHTITHIGPYHHIGNAWSAQMQRQRGKRFKPNKGIPPIEVYKNSPQDTDEKELISEIHIPIK